MKTNELIKKIKGTFKLPKKKYYFGELRFGNPYFYPWNFNATMLTFRKLKLKDKEVCEKLFKEKPWLNENEKFSNYPTFKRSRSWVKKIFNNYYYIALDWPICITWNELGWKTKYDTPRFEYPPAFQIYFFKLQFCIFWKSPCGDSDSKYYEQIIWYINYADCDLKKAKETWPWVNGTTKQSTWDDNYLI